MSNSITANAGEVARQTAVETAWVQWAALTSAAVPMKLQRAHSIVDPEALVLISLAMQDRERRLSDLLAAWAHDASFLLSVQRINSLVPAYPAKVRARLRDFAALSVGFGDRRWQRHANSSQIDQAPHRRKDLGPLRLIEGPALMLRLRAGFGVGTKSDLLSFLLGLHGAAAELKVLAIATGYTERALRKATEDMERAGMIYRTEVQPPTFSAPYLAWAHVLDAYGLGAAQDAETSMPHWRFWLLLFPFLAGVIEWASQAEDENWTEYVASSRARDLTDAHQAAFRRAEIPVPDSRATRGADYLKLFSELLLRIRAWASDQL